jgi:CMP-N,N'-diacetyllegionaminic acid synthase
MRVIGVIPARGGSKGIPMKNVKQLNGKPLIAYTIEAALASNLDRVIVSTDCTEIARISIKYKAEVAMRPDKLAQDDTPTLLVLQDLMSNMVGEYDAVMTLQPTSPLRTVGNINKAIEDFNNDTYADSLVSVVKVPHNFMPEKLMTHNGQYLNGSSSIKRRQEVSEIYARNGASIYITKIDRLGQYMFGGKILPFFMDKLSSIDIDDMEDWIMLEALVKSQNDDFKFLNKD